MDAQEFSGQVQVLWGDGKGKTTSALGTALRACGNGYKVHLVQFMKNGAQDPEIEIPGEILALKKMETFSYRRFGAGSWVIGKPNDAHLQAVHAAYEHVLSSFLEPYNIIIADEILYAVQLKLLSEAEVLSLIRRRPKDKELILTGSHQPFPAIFELANLVTEVKKIKHPYDSGLSARKGIEY